MKQISFFYIFPKKTRQAMIWERFLFPMDDWCKKRKILGKTGWVATLSQTRPTSHTPMSSGGLEDKSLTLELKVVGSRPGVATLLFSSGFPFNVELKYTRSQWLGRLGCVVERFTPLVLELKVVCSRLHHVVIGDGGVGPPGLVQDLLSQTIPLDDSRK